jgi:peroxiredoxin
MRRRFVVMKMLPWLLAASCAETLQTPAPTQNPATAPIATDLLQEMDAAYANASSYEDSGTVTTVFSGASSHAQKLSFETAFVRHQRFRFEYRSNREFRGRALGSERMVIWSDFAHTYTEWTTVPGIDDDGPNLGFALGAAAGVSSGSSMTIATLLLHYGARSRRLQLRAPAVDGDEAIDGHACWRVKGANRRGDPMTVWIDRATHLIRKIETSHHFATFDTNTTTVFQPEIDRPVVEAHLQPPDVTANPPHPRKPLPPEPWTGLWFESNAPKVRSVVPGGPADRAGLQAGDEIVAFNNRRLVDSSEVGAAVHLAGIGANVTLTVMRGGAKLDISVTLQARYYVPDAVRKKLLDKAAPVFDLPVVTGGGSAKLASLSGSVVILEFWSSSCSPCASQVPHLNDLIHKYPALHVIGLSGDAPDDIRQFAKDNQVAYTLAHDANDTVWNAFLGSAYPMLVVIDKTGIVRDVQVGAGDSTKLDDIVAGLLK